MKFKNHIKIKAIFQEQTCHYKHIYIQRMIYKLKKNVQYRNFHSRKSELRALFLNVAELSQKRFSAFFSVLQKDTCNNNFILNSCMHTHSTNLL